MRAESVYDDGGRHADVEAVQLLSPAGAGGDEDPLGDHGLQVGGDPSTLATEYYRVKY